VNAAKMLVTFGVVTFAWIFFRANNLGDAWYITRHLLSWHFDPSMLMSSGFTRATAPFLLLFTIAMFVVEWWIAHPAQTPKLWSSPAFRALAYNVCVYCTIFFGFFGHRDFIYFQF
jgi:D-alanyl-lipoteichoic acid acyltransferase DltB (MBOAT superfamily)